MNISTYKELLKEFVSYKSISTDPEYKQEINKTVNWLQELFKKHTFEIHIFEGKTTNPVVLAYYNVSDDAQTVLVYGHYDVQPASIEEGWDNDPFTVQEKDNKLIARGIVDNKGQIMIHIATVLDLIKQNKLKYNVKFLIEGNEETSNPDLKEIMQTNKELLKSDYVLASDGELVDGKPAIEASLRGGCNLTLTYKTANNNVHSGIFGGAIPNAAHELTKLLSKLYDPNNSVAIPDFYKDADDVTEEQHKNNEHISHTAEKLLNHIGVKKLLTENNYDFYTQTGQRPTLQITGIKTGYIGNGYANIIPATAEARINFRIVASQKPKDVIEAFAHFVKSNTPEYVEYNITTDGLHNPVKIDLTSAIMQEVREKLFEAYDNQPVIRYVGGAIPFVGDIKELFGINTILVPLANDDCNMHGTNENFKIDLITHGLKFSELFFSK
jgi:acetylornithine deacetylase/succinyl-diaminopimelate desuccinylase-like protein